MSKHTPGPWKANRCVDSAYSVENDAAGHAIGWAIRSENASNAIAHVWQIAGEQDANLIAAAPDMYEALCLILGQLEATHPEMSTLSYGRAALAKAEGR